MADQPLDSDPVSSVNDLPKEMFADNSGNLEPIKGVEKQGNLSEVKPGGPSWNDPPMVKFYDGSVGTSSGNLKHIKRVGKTGADIDSSVPDPSTTTPKDDEKCVCVYSDQISDSEKKSFVADTFRNILFQPTWDEKKNLKDIERRMNLLEQSWEKLSSDVKQNMYKLAHELTVGHIDKALKIHCHLMVHHVREVKNWMVAIKHLIGMKKEILDRENINLRETSTDPNS